MSEMYLDPNVTDLVCPYCGSKNDGHTPVDEDTYVAPKDGDLSLCLFCAEAAIYVGTTKLKKATISDLSQVELIAVQKAQKVIKAYQLMVKEGQDDPRAVPAPSTDD